MISNSYKNIVSAYSKGFRVSKDGITVSHNGKKIKICFNKDGYQRFSFRVSKESIKSITVHRLMAYQKYGEKIADCKICVRHLNGNKNDNSFDNILIGSARDNSLDIPKDERIRLATNASRRGQEKINKYNRFHVYQMLFDGISYSKIIAFFGISKGTLSYMKNNSKEFQEFCSKRNKS